MMHMAKKVASARRGALIATALGFAFLIAVAGCDKPTAPSADPKSTPAPSAPSAKTDAHSSEESAKPQTLVKRVGADLSGPLRIYAASQTKENIKVTLLSVSKMTVLAPANDRAVLKRRPTGAYQVPCVQVKYMVEFLGTRNIESFDSQVLQVAAGGVALPQHNEVQAGVFSEDAKYDSQARWPEDMPDKTKVPGPSRPTAYFEGGFLMPKAAQEHRTTVYTQTFRGLVPDSETVEIDILARWNGEEQRFTFADVML